MDLAATISEQPPSGFAEHCRAIWHGRVTATEDCGWHRIRGPMGDLVAVCEWLTGPCGYVFATLVVEKDTPAWRLTYMFHARTGGQWAEVETFPPESNAPVPSIAAVIPAADWHEREAADLFGLTFAGHPRTRPFVLHEGWPDHVPLMGADSNIRGAFTPAESTPPPIETERPSSAPGGFAMPIGPVYSDSAESAHFRIESLGEDVNRLGLQFFYKYRAVEKLAEGQAVDAALLLAERFSGSAAFAHGLAFCQAVEAICGISPSPRALALRTLLAELERLRHHTATITGICNSTALVVATSLAAIIEEELLRLSCIVSGHRYFFGALTLGGLRTDIPDARCRELHAAVSAIAKRLDHLERMLRQSSSFLDRLEEVGIVPAETASLLGLVGPVARASGVLHDMRALFPYAAYARYAPDVPVEAEGDGYARLRVLFREAAIAAALICDVSAALPSGPVSSGPVRPVPGAALGVVEAPLGAAFHCVRLAEDGIVRRLRISPPSFANWRGFQWAAETFAFQDFPIILATFGLSNAENDR
jgi:formate hydrogenlyase subunit 5